LGEATDADEDNDESSDGRDKHAQLKQGLHEVQSAMKGLAKAQVLFRGCLDK
jgi:hypothetical protein